MDKLIEVSENSPLSDIREAIIEHYKSNPDHGPGCACLDPVIRLIRTQLNPLAFNYTELRRRSREERNGDDAVYIAFSHALRG